MVKRERDLYYCRHSQFPNCPVRNVLPVDPDWLIEALGIVEFKDNEQHEGPYPSVDGKNNWVIITRRTNQNGQFVKKTTVDAKTGLVSKQEIFSPQNEMIAAAISDDYRLDVQSGISYARKVEIYYAGATGKITINLGSPQFNQTTNIASNLYTMPTYEGRNPVDICSEEFLRSRTNNYAPLTNAPITPTPQPTPNPNPNPIPNVNSNTPAALIPSTLSNNTVQNSLSQNNNIPTYRYNNTTTSQGSFQTEIR
jgi:hypothetical protein